MTRQLLLVLLAGFFVFPCSKHEMNDESLSSSSSFWSYLIFGRLFAANIAFRFLTVQLVLSFPAKGLLLMLFVVGSCALFLEFVISSIS